MHIHQNYSPLALLIVFFVLMAVVLGLLLSGTELFNPTQARQQANSLATSDAIAARREMANIAATETPGAFQEQLRQMGTVAAVEATLTPLAANARATSIPAQIAADRAIALATHESLQADATQTRMAYEAAMQSHAATATVVALARESQSENNSAIAQTLYPLALMAVIAIFVVALGIAMILRASAHANAARARAYTEERRLRIAEVEFRHEMEATAAARAPETVPPPIIRETFQEPSVNGHNGRNGQAANLSRRRTELARRGTE